MVVQSVRKPANRGAAATADSPRSIAILPFANIDGDSTNEPFSDGIADELTTALGKVDQLSVMARTSAFSLKRKGLDAREIGRQLHVQYVLEGSVQRAVNKIVYVDGRRDGHNEALPYYYTATVAPSVSWSRRSVT